MLVAPNTAEDDVIFLSALECVDAGDFDFFVQILLQRTVKLHVVDDVGPLSFVRCNDTNLAWHYARLKELGHNLLDIRRFSTVEEGSTAARNLFLTKVLVEEHWRIRDGPWEVDILPQTLRSRDTVLKCAFVEHVGREVGQARVHSVLDLKADRSISQNNEAFEERLSETCTGSLLVHDDRSKLLEAVRTRVDRNDTSKSLPDGLQQERPAYSPEREESYILRCECQIGVDHTKQENLPGSAACVASSIRTVLNFNLLNLGSPAPTQVQQMTSAAPKISFSH